MPFRTGFTTLTPEEAVTHIPDGATVAFSGFANAGAAKVVPREVAAKARKLHGRGEPFKIRVLGASCGDDVDEKLALARAIKLARSLPEFAYTAQTNQQTGSRIRGYAPSRTLGRRSHRGFSARWTLRSWKQPR